MPFKVIEVGTYRKLVCDFLLVIKVTDILCRTASELSQLIVQILDIAFLSLPLWGVLIDNTYDVHFGAWTHTQFRRRLKTRLLKLLAF